MQSDKLTNDENEFYKRLLDMIFGKSDLKTELTHNESDTIDRVLGTLNKRERETITRINLDQITVADIARDYHIGKEQANLILAKALRKLRHPSRLKVLKSIINDYTKNEMK